MPPNNSSRILCGEAIAIPPTWLFPNSPPKKLPEVGVEGRRKPERAKERLEMVASQIEARGIRNPGVLEAMRRVERHRFIPPDGQAFAYRDGPVAIGQGQTISQPYIVACMTEVLEAPAKRSRARDRHRLGIPDRSPR